jgi:hypothetical protein
VALLRHVRLGQWAWLALAFLFLAAANIRSVKIYRSVRRLAIDWSRLEPDGALAHTLIMLARDVESLESFPWIVNLGVLAVVSFFTFTG